MAQIRIQKNKSFTHLENKMLQNCNLSLKARGLLAYMLSLPEDWNYSIAGLAFKCKEGKTSIRSAIDELIAEGYIVRRLVRTDKGLLDGYEYTVYEEPQLSCDDPEPSEESAKPSFDFQTTDYPTSENRTEQNNKETKEPRNTPHTPQGGRARTVPTYRPEWFERFWTLYPRKTNRVAAVRAWDKLRPDFQLCETMAKALRAQINMPQWKEGTQHIPHPSTWLNGARWLDEVVSQKPKGGGEERVASGWR